MHSRTALLKQAQGSARAADYPRHSICDVHICQKGGCGGREQPCSQAWAVSPAMSLHLILPVESPKLIELLSCAAQQQFARALPLTRQFRFDGPIVSCLTALSLFLTVCAVTHCQAAQLAAGLSARTTRYITNYGDQRHIDSTHQGGNLGQGCDRGRLWALAGLHRQ